MFLLPCYSKLREPRIGCLIRGSDELKTPLRVYLSQLERFHVYAQRQGTQALIPALLPNQCESTKAVIQSLNYHCGGLVVDFHSKEESTYFRIPSVRSSSLDLSTSWLRIQWQTQGDSLSRYPLFLFDSPLCANYMLQQSWPYLSQFIFICFHHSLLLFGQIIEDQLVLVLCSVIGSKTLLSQHTILLVRCEHLRK